MAKTHLKMPNGTKMTIEGTPDDVAALLARLQEKSDMQKPSAQFSSPKVSRNNKQEKPTPINLISSLIDGGFFKKPKDLGAVKLALEEQGHYFPITTLSPVLLRLVRKRQLRRIKEKKRWLYNG